MSSVSTPPSRVRVAAALLAAYVIWGSTYLGLKFGLDGFPPFLLNGIRLVVAGSALYAWLRSRGGHPPTATQWRNGALIGTLMFVGGLGLVTVAEDNGVGSGLVAAGVAVMPLWAAFWAGMFGQWPTRIEWVGLAVGFVGVVLLSREGDFQASAIGTILMVVSPILWALGSVVGTRIDLARGAMSSATYMLGGGSVLLIAGLGRGERITEMPGLGAWLALLYLIVAGSIIAFTAYLYLLANTRPAVATSYAYVNPVVAVILGITLGGEVVEGWAYVALPVILGGVALVGYAQRVRARFPLTTSRTEAGTP